MKSIRSFAPLVAAGVLAAGTGFLAAAALSAGSQAPTKTVTVDVGTGETGPTGPAGATGPAGPPGEPGTPGAESCPAGYSFGAVVFNHPGGHLTIATCVAD
jgi:hypothetical protein